MDWYAVTKRKMLSAALTAVSIVAVAAVSHDEVNHIRAVAQVLRDVRVHERGLPWNIGQCKPRCIEADGLWDDCISTFSPNKCFQHCYVCLIDTARRLQLYI